MTLGSLPVHTESTVAGLAKARIGDLGDFDELLRIWRHPGWTTPAELYFASGLLDAMVAQIKPVIDLKAMLLNGSEAVIAGA